MNIADRFAVSLSRGGITQRQLAAALGISPTLVNGWTREKSKIGRHAKRVAEILHVPEEWLVHGTGPVPSWLVSVSPTTVETKQTGDDMQKSLSLLGEQVRIMQGQIGSDPEKSKALEKMYSDLCSALQKLEKLEKRDEKREKQIDELVHQAKVANIILRRLAEKSGTYVPTFTKEETVEAT